MVMYCICPYTHLYTVDISVIPIPSHIHTCESYTCIHISVCTFMQKTTTATRSASEEISRVCAADISGDELPGEQEVHTQRPGGQEHTNGRRGHL